jgi:membrane protease YdiL (CAAX protease family)
VADWTAFWAVAGLVLFLVLGLAWLTSGAIGGGRSESRGSDDRRSRNGAPSGRARSHRNDPIPLDSFDDGSVAASREAGGPLAVGRGADRSVPDSSVPSVGSIPTSTLFANVLLTHGGLGLVLLGAAALAGIPAAALGVEGTAWSTGWPALLGGLAFGTGLATANVGLAATLDRIGVEHTEDLRAALAPESGAGWALLFVGVLPLVAVFEELLFRAVLIGGAEAATGLSPWLFVALSSVAFALGHGIQGKSGIAVTGLLGGVLGVGYVLTNSLLLVSVAHYVVNAVEFLLKEWLGVDFG